MSMRTAVFCLAVVVQCSRALADQPSCTPGPLRTDSTPTCISIEWDLAGDSDHDATCSIQYRQEGSNEWKEALPLFRVDYQWWYDTQRAERPFNMFAGSIMFLKPGTTYEVRLDLADPDGGNQSREIEVATRPIPALPTGGRVLHVKPGSGGGSGSADDPLWGLAAAQEAADAGDILLLHQGDYGQFAFEKSGRPGRYLVYKAAGDGEAVFASVHVKASHLWLEGLTFRRKDNSNGLRAQGPAVDVVLRGNTLSGYHYAITLSNQSRNWHITDNVIVGDNDPNQPTVQGGTSGEGVELNHSGGHVVAYNSISRVADGVSYPERNVDIYGNEIFDVSDDGLEPDRGYANVRMWGNRITNAQNFPLSFQPMRCGPWYFVRNLVVGNSRGVFKFRVQDRFALVNNTFVVGKSASNHMHHILSSLSRNNLYISIAGTDPIWTAYNCSKPQYCLPNNYQPNWMTDVDYDGFDWGDSPEAFRWETRRRFSDLESFAQAVGIEQHGIRVRKEDIFAQWNIAREPMRIPPQHLALRPGSKAVDAGAAVPNLSDDFQGRAPDLGAYELGRPLPHYGPRVVETR